MSFSKYTKVRGKFESLETRQLFAADLVGGAVVDAPATADSAPVATASDRCEAPSFRLQLDGIANQMSLMQSFSYNGTTMRKNDTSVAGDQYQTDTCHVDEYGTISMALKSDSDSKDGIPRVKDQYEGSLAGTKPNGTVILSDRSGNDTVNWNINGWHIENFSVDQLMSQLGGQEGEALVDTIGSPTDGLIAIIALNGETPEKHHVSPQEIDGEATDKDHKGFTMSLGDIKGEATDKDHVSPQKIDGEATDKDHKGFTNVDDQSAQVSNQIGQDSTQTAQVSGQVPNTDDQTAFEGMKGTASDAGLVDLETGPINLDTGPVNLGADRLNLEHGPGLHDSVHCLVGGIMRTAQSSKGPVFAVHERLVDQLMAENGCPNKTDAEVLPGKTNYLPWHRG
jgi:hypothetical protein